MKKHQIVGPIFMGGLAIALAGGMTTALADDVEQHQAGQKYGQEQQPAGMQEGQAEMQQQGQAGMKQARTATAGEIARNPAKFYGQKVQVSAEVEDVYNAHAFTLDEDELFAGPDVLVLNPAPLSESKDGSNVTVTGTIQQFVRADIERDYDWFDNNWLESGTEEIDFSTRPVLIADSVRTSDGQELVRGGETMGTRAGDQPAGSKEEKLGPHDERMKERPIGGDGDPGMDDTGIDRGFGR